MYKFIISLIFISLCWSCNNGKSTAELSTLPVEDEEKIFMLVYKPGYEGRFQEAVDKADSLLGIYDMSDSLKAYILCERTVALINMGDLTRGKTSNDTLIDFARNAGINSMLTQGLMMRGMYYKRHQQYDSALVCYNEALDMSIAEKDIEMEQSVVELIAVAFAESKHIPEAIKFSERSLELAKEMNDSIAILQSVSTLAGALSLNQNNKEVIDRLLPYKSFMELGSPIHSIKYLTPIFYAYLNLDSMEQARQTMAEIDAAVAMIPERHAQSAIAKIAKAKLMAKEHRYDEEYALYIAVDTLQPIGRKTEVVMHEKALCLANMGRTEEAFHLMENAYEKLDSTRVSDVEKELNELSVRYETLTKQIEIERLSRQRWVMINVITMILIVVAILIAMILFNRWRYRRRLYQESQEQYIRGLEQERQRIARELHDDIAGELIGLQWETTKLSETETSARIYAIGERVRRLSHEMMPPEFSSQTLCQLLMDMMHNFNATHSRPKMELTDEGSFDWIKLSPQENYELYRIVQESVNNALKHSNASFIRITLDGDNKFELSIANDGIDNSGASEKGIGTFTLKARAQIIGAQIVTEINDTNYKLTIRQK